MKTSPVNQLLFLPSFLPSSTLFLNFIQVEHVLATQTLVQAKAKNMRVQVNGPLEAGVTSKDLILHVIGVIGTAGGTG